LQGKMKKIAYVFNIGFFAGVIWGGIKLLEYGLKFTKVSPGFVIEPFFKHSFLISWWGLALGWASFVILSMAAAWIYGWLFHQIKGPYLGLAYGLVWWILIYMGIGPWIGMVIPAWQLDWNTITTDICLFILWGLFIGYSIAMEFTEEESREPK
jgi:hypothetical protein